jgi:hypothetical protein
MEKTGHYSMKLSQEEFEKEFSFYKYEDPKKIVKSLLKKFPSSYLELQGMPGSQSVCWVYENININISNW